MSRSRASYEEDSRHDYDSNDCPLCCKHVPLSFTRSSPTNFGYCTDRYGALVPWDSIHMVVVSPCNTLAPMTQTHLLFFATALLPRLLCCWHRILRLQATCEHAHTHELELPKDCVLARRQWDSSTQGRIRSISGEVLQQANFGHDLPCAQLLRMPTSSNGDRRLASS